MAELVAAPLALAELVLSVALALAELVLVGEALAELVLSVALAPGDCDRVADRAHCAGARVGLVVLVPPARRWDPVRTPAR